MLGRVFDALGNPIDGLGPVKRVPGSGPEPFFLSKLNADERSRARFFGYCRPYEREHQTGTHRDRGCGMDVPVAQQSCRQSLHRIFPAG